MSNSDGYTIQLSKDKVNLSKCLCNMPILVLTKNDLMDVGRATHIHTQSQKFLYQNFHDIYIVTHLNLAFFRRVAEFMHYDNTRQAM